MRSNAGSQETVHLQGTAERGNSEVNVCEIGGLLFHLHGQTLLSSQANQIVNK